MIRLSRKGWNNVLIFSCLFLIILFHQTSRFVSEPVTTHPEYLLPPSLPIMQIDFGGQKLQRIGQGWRLTPTRQKTESELAQLVQNWQSAKIELAVDDTDEPSLVVVIWLAGESQGRVFQLFEQEQGLLVKTSLGLYRIQSLTLNQLFPGE